MDVAVEIGPGQGDDARNVRLIARMLRDGRMAFSGVQRDEQIAMLAAPLGTDLYVPAELAEALRPAQRGDPIASVRPWARGRGNERGQLIAHVRNPAQTSRRSGR